MYATDSASQASTHGQPVIRPNNLAERILTTPAWLRASDIMTSGANQMSASQACFSESRSSQVMTRASKSAERPAIATKVLEMPCQGDVTQPAMTPRKIARSEEHTSE